MTDIDTTLAEREKTHGRWIDTAGLFDTLIGALEKEEVWGNLSPTCRAAITMICMKMARIVCGDPEHPDHWRDIAGYASLEERRINPPAHVEANMDGSYFTEIGGRRRAAEFIRDNLIYGEGPL